MRIEEKKVFNVYKKKFLSGEYDLNTIVCLLADIRHSMTRLNHREFRKLIEIPVSVAMQDVMYNDDKFWIEEFEPNHRSYFKGNLYPLREYEVFSEIYNMDDELPFHIEDFVCIAEHIKENFDKLSKSKLATLLECPLRNLEVCIGECRIFNKDNFYMNGDIFAKYIEDAINM